jgi:hypothetical protein
MYDILCMFIATETWAHESDTMAAIAVETAEDRKENTNDFKIVAPMGVYLECEPGR